MAKTETLNRRQRLVWRTLVVVGATVTVGLLDMHQRARFVGEAQIGAQGGLLETPGGVRVKVPAGAVDQLTAFTAQPTQPIEHKVLVGTGPAIKLEPSGQTFKKPVTVTLPVQLESRHQNRELRVLHRNDQTGEVTWLRPKTVGETSLTVEVAHFSSVQAALPVEIEYGEETIAIGPSYGDNNTKTFTFENSGPAGDYALAGYMDFWLYPGDWTGDATLTVAVNGVEVHKATSTYFGGVGPTAMTVPENWSGPFPGDHDGHETCVVKAEFALPIGDGRVGRPLVPLVQGTNNVTISLSGTWGGNEICDPAWGAKVHLFGAAPGTPLLSLDGELRPRCSADGTLTTQTGQEVFWTGNGSPSGGTMTWSVTGPVSVKQITPNPSDPSESFLFLTASGLGEATITVTYNVLGQSLSRTRTIDVMSLLQKGDSSQDFAGFAGLADDTLAGCGDVLEFEVRHGLLDNAPTLELGITEFFQVATFFPDPAYEIVSSEDDTLCQATISQVRWTAHPLNPRFGEIDRFTFRAPGITRHFLHARVGTGVLQFDRVSVQVNNSELFLGPISGPDVVASGRSARFEVDPLQAAPLGGVIDWGSTTGSSAVIQFRESKNTRLATVVARYVHPACGTFYRRFEVQVLGTRPSPRPTAPQECKSGKLDAACVCKTQGDVILHNGEERFDRTDLVIPGRGEIHFAFRRRYRSRLDYDGPLGFGWDHDYNDQLFVQENGDVLRLNGGGHADTWKKNADGSYLRPPGFFSVLVRLPDQTFVLRDPNGFKRRYSSEGLLTTFEDRNGNAMTFEHDSRDRLVKVLDAYQRAITFEYIDVRGRARISKIRDFSGREVVYTYDANADLVAVRTPTVSGTTTGNNFPTGRTERYTYSTGSAEADLNHNLLSFTRPEEVASGGAATQTWTYGTDPNNPATFDRVLTETRGGTNASGVAAGGTLTFAYAPLNQTQPLGNLALPRGKATVTDRNGNVTEYFVNEKNHHILTRRLTRGLRPGEPAAYEIRSEYDEDGQLTKRTFPEGNSVVMTYDRTGPREAHRNVLSVRRLADSTRGGGSDLVTTYTYEPLFQRLASVTDPRGNAAGYVPPMGTASADRYTTHFFFDYQESNAAIPEATTFGIDLTGFARNLGDLDGDGSTGQQAGNVVRIQAPIVQLRPGSNEAQRLGDTKQLIVVQTSWNTRGQMTQLVDPEGNVTELTYHPENDPDGDGIAVVSSDTLPTASRGYLETVTRDAKVSPRRTAAAAPTILATTLGYDRVGNITSIKDPRGVVTTIEVNQLNEPVVVTRGAQITDAVSSGQLITGEVAFSYKTRMTYDFNGRVTKYEVENRDSNTAGVGQFVDRTFTYDILDNLVQTGVEIDATTTLVTQLRYDSNENLIRAIQPEGNVHTVLYDERDLAFKLTRGVGAPGASTVQIDYDKNANRIKITDAQDNDGDGQPESTALAYDGFDRLIKTTDPLSNRLELSYDPASNLVRRRVFGHPANQPTGAAVPLLDVTIVPDEMNRTCQVDEVLFLANGFSAQRAVDLRDHNSDGKVTTIVEHDALSRPTYRIEDDQETTRTIYDGANRPVQRLDALGNSFETTYDKNDNPIRVRSVELSPESLVPSETYATVYVWDQLNRMVRLTDNAGQTMRLKYDSRDNVTQRSDLQGALIPDPLGLFPAAGQSGLINGPGNTKSFFYDGLDRTLLEVSDLRVGGEGAGALDTSNPANPDGQVSLSYVWDKNSRLSAIVDDNGNRTSYGYDALNRRTSQINADQTTWQYAFDRDHNPTQITDPNGTVVGKTYDALNRLLRCDVQRAVGVAGTTVETFSYDGLSRLTRSTDDNGGDASVTQTCEYVYDSLSRVLEERFNGKAVSTVFSGDGKRVKCTFPGGRVIDATFDAIDRVKTRSEAGNAIVSYDYVGPALRELRRVNGNGTSLSYLGTGGVQDGYDAVKRVARQRHFLPGGVSTFLDRTYTYNRQNVRTSETRGDDGGLTDRYTYDSIYRLVTTDLDSGGQAGATRRELQKLAYRFDGVGNRVEVNETRGTPGGGGQAQTALLAQSSVEVGPGSKVKGDVVANDPAPKSKRWSKHKSKRWGWGRKRHHSKSKGKANVTLQPFAQVEGKVTGDAVTLKSKAKVLGDVATNRLRQDRGSVITGSVGPATVPAEPLPQVQGITTGRQNFVSRRNQQVILNPGRYGKIVLRRGAKLTLPGGVYELDSLTLGPLTTVCVQAAVTIRVRKRLKFLLGACVVPAQGLVVGDVLWETTTQKKVFLGQKTVFFGVLVAPKAEVEVLTKARVTGSVQAKEIRIGPWVRVTSPGGSGPSTTTETEAYTVNVMNEYTSKGGVARSHSNTGNLQDDGARIFQYDYKNRLVAVWDKASNTPRSAYLYYGDGRRAKTIVFSAQTAGVVERETLFFYDGWQVCEEQNAQGLTETTYVYGHYVDDLVQFVRTTAHPLGAGTFYSHCNARFDVVATTDASGQVVERRFYDDFGRQFGADKQPVAGSAVGNPYGFQGRRLDVESGLYYFRHRYYDPDTGRFVQRDPIWDPGNVGNQYSFVGNGPNSSMDPLGLSATQFLESFIRGFYAGGAAFGKGMAALGGMIWGSLTGQGDGLSKMKVDAGMIGDITVGVLTAVLGKTIMGTLLLDVGYAATKGAIGAAAASLAGRDTVCSFAFEFAKGLGGALLGAGLTKIIMSLGKLRGAGDEAAKAVDDASKAAKPKKACPVRNCFVAGTLVETRSGKKRIEDVRVGDEVLSRDEETGREGYKRVVRLLRNTTNTVVKVTLRAKPSSTLAAGRGVSGKEDSQTVECTPGHPWFVQGDGWTYAGELSVGDRITGSEGTTLEIVAIAVEKRSERTFNLEVADWHTYYVAGAPGKPSAWVHNTSFEVQFVPGSGSWRQGFPGELQKGMVYELWDRSGARWELLKVGHAENMASLWRYQRAAAITGRTLTLEAVPSSPVRTERVAHETRVRSRWEAKGLNAPRMPWDNTGDRLGRPGPATPGQGRGFNWEGEKIIGSPPDHPYTKWKQAGGGC